MNIRYLGVIIIVSLSVLFIYQTHLEPFYSFSLRFNDLNFKYQDKEASAEVVFIKIDEESVNRFGRWPWDRSILAEAISKLDDSSIVVLDMVFSEPTENDTILAQSLRKQNNNICGFFLRHASSSPISDSDLEVLSDSSLARLSSQLGDEKAFVEGKEAEINIEPILSSCTLLATFSTFRDNDQLFRQYPLAFTFKGELYPSIGVQALRMKYNQDLIRHKPEHFLLAEHELKTNLHGFSMINYYPSSSYVSYSFLDLYEGKIAKSALMNKIIILGITEVGIGDMRATPIGMLPGALIHATFISNVLNDELLYQNKNLDLSLILVFMLLPLAWMVLTSIFKRTLLYASAYLLLFIVGKFCFVYYNLYIDTFYPLLALVFVSVASEVLLHQAQEKQSKFIEGAFSSYLSPVLLQKLMKEPERLSLGGEKKELSIFFSDIRSFTSISETMDPQKLTQLLNRYFTPMSDIIMDHNGMIDKYIGDAVMAFFNAPIDVENHAYLACQSSLEMMDELQRLNEEFSAEDLPLINIGIGLNTAEVVVGNMGSDKRFNYTVIGDGVNLASRVEGLNKTYGTNIIITEFTQVIIRDDFLTRPIESVRVKGKKEAVMIYELLKDNAYNRECVRLYNVARNLYVEGKLMEALTAFEVLKDDSVSQYFVQRISQEKVN